METGSEWNALLPSGMLLQAFGSLESTYAGAAVSISTIVEVESAERNFLVRELALPLSMLESVFDRRKKAFLAYKQAPKKSDHRKKALENYRTWLCSVLGTEKYLKLLKVTKSQLVESAKAR